MDTKTYPGKTRILLTSMLLIGFLAATDAAAQGSRPGSGWGPQSSYNRLYDPATVETLCGVIVRIERTMPVRGMSEGIHLILKTDSETVPVHLGPAWYLDNQDTQLHEGNEVEVLGSRITFDREPAILAVAVKRGAEGLHLRDPDGNPAWSAWRSLR